MPDMSAAASAVSTINVDVSAVARVDNFLISVMSSKLRVRTIILESRSETVPPVSV
jgi:hypothetical protein